MKISALKNSAIQISAILGIFTSGCIQNPANPGSNSSVEFPSLDSSSAGFNEPGPQATPVSTESKKFQNKNNDDDDDDKQSANDSHESSQARKNYGSNGFLKINWQAVARCNRNSLDAAHIKVSSVKIRYSKLGWHQVSTDAFRLNLIETQNQINDLFIRTHVPAGEITEIRFQTEEDGTATLSDGSHAPLVIPSEEHSGLKIKFKQPLVIQTEKMSGVRVHLDFEKSFLIKRISCGKSQVTLKPVVWATYTTEQIPVEISPVSQEPVDVAQEINTPELPSSTSQEPASNWTDTTPPTPVDDGGAYVPVLGI